MKNNVRLASCGLLAVALVACGGGSGGSPTQSNSEGFQNGYNSFSNTLTDSRDGQVYRTVTIGNQTWMAENLNYEYKINGKVYGNYCHFEGCSPYGRYYTWAAAMDSAGINGSYDGKECGLGKICGPKSPVQGICPKGWHLPSEAEWETLYREGVRGNALSLSAVGVDGDGDIYRAEAQGYNKWLAYPDTSNLASGFSALPAGHYHADWFVDVGSSACFWSADEYNEEDAKYFDIFRGLEGAVRESFDRERGDLGGKSRGLSIRCLKDDVYNRETSSSSVESRSTFEVSSSVGPLEKPCKTEAGDNCEYGLMTDARDGKTYKTVKIGDQVWMAENLNYEVENSGCYNNSADSCSKYGLLYTWDAAMKACPNGWHLPDTSEWRTLYSAMGNSPYAMQAKCVAKWPNATDAYCFSALPLSCEMVNGDGSYGNVCRIGSVAAFWSASEYSSALVFLWSLDADGAELDGSDKDVGHSVRCLKNDAFYQEPSESSAKTSNSFGISSNSAENTCVDSKSNSCPEQSELGTICDNRDGKIYKVVTIGMQTWMIENLNFSSCNIKGSCYDNNPDNCNQYGRLYSWTDVMGLDKSYQNKYSNLTGLQQGVCPQGFHIPSDAEVDELIAFVDANSSDTYLLAILFGGKKSSSDFTDLGKKAYFWTADEDYTNFGGPSNVIIWTYSDTFGFNGGSVFKNSELSVRCVKD